MSMQSKKQPNWHPDFSIKSTLPDTRTIHSNFIVKLVIFTAFLIVTVIVLQREYQGYTLRQAISGLEQQVQIGSEADRLRLKKSDQFRELALDVIELQRFYRAPVLAHDYLVELALVRPEGLTITQLTLSEFVIKVKVGEKTKPQAVFRLNISGKVQELPVLTQFKRELEKSNLLHPSGYSIEISETIDQRDTATGIIPFQLTVLLETNKDKSSANKNVK